MPFAIVSPCHEELDFLNKYQIYLLVLETEIGLSDQSLLIKSISDQFAASVLEIVGATFSVVALNTCSQPQPSSPVH
jgi:hypothetical protein